MNPAEAGRLIDEATSGTRALSADELQQLAEFMAEVGFARNARERVRGRLAGMVWRGRTLQGTDTLAPAEVHYLWHVVKRSEWPAGTSLGE